MRVATNIRVASIIIMIIIVSEATAWRTASAPRPRRCC